MDPIEELHLNRARAESFGRVAEQYDRYRPAAPSALVDELAALAPKRVLDVACGTGKGALALAARVPSLLGIEIDPRMAELARGHGLEVEVASFEAWDPMGRTFDLVVCANAWHWIDPKAGLAQVERVLAAGGTFVRFFSFYVLPDAVVAALEPVYARLAPDAHAHGRNFDRDVERPADERGTFTGVERRSYRAPRTLTTQDWLGLLGTYSDHQRLGPARLGPLLEEVRRVLDGFGGRVDAEAVCYAIWAIR